MRRRQQPTPSSSSSCDSDGSDIESCFDTGDEQEETDAETEPTDVDTDVDGNDEADLPDLEWLAHSDNARTVPMDVDAAVDGDDEPDLAWLAGEENAHPPEYYLDQEDNSDGSEDEDEDYSDGSLLLLDMIEGQFDRCVPYSLLACRLLLSNR
jgi:hypothetical protein